MIVSDDPFLGEVAQLAALSLHHAIPTIGAVRNFTRDGGLVSYSSIADDIARQAGVYVGRILQGTKPSDLPIAQPTKFSLAINLKTARVLGLTVPQSLLARADEVIE